MESSGATHAMDPAKLKGTLHDWLEETKVKSACGVGINNFLKEKSLVNARVYLSQGKTEYFPAEKVEPSKCAAGLFAKVEYALKGTSGCVCYDISETNLMICVLWEVPLSARVSENKYNIRCMEKAECDQKLYDMLYENCRKADGELMQEENGFRLCGCMNRDLKCMLIVDCYDSGSVGSLRESEPVRSGHDLNSRLHDFLDATHVKRACAIGINNYTGTALVTPKMYVATGRCVFEPASIVDTEMASPALFAKRRFSLAGTSGCITYEIKGTPHILALMWYIPLGQALRENKFFATVMIKTDCNADLYRLLWKEARHAKEGDYLRQEITYQITSRMETSPRATFIINLRPYKQRGWLW